MGGIHAAATSARTARSFVTHHDAPASLQHHYSSDAAARGPPTVVTPRPAAAHNRRAQVQRPATALKDPLQGCWHRI